LPDQSQVSLMNERGRLECVVGTFLTQLVSCYGAKLFIYQGKEIGSRLRFAFDQPTQDPPGF